MILKPQLKQHVEAAYSARRLGDAFERAYRAAEAVQSERGAVTRIAVDLTAADDDRGDLLFGFRLFIDLEKSVGWESYVTCDASLTESSIKWILLQHVEDEIRSWRDSYDNTPHN